MCENWNPLQSSHLVSSILVLSSRVVISWFVWYEIFFICARECIIVLHKEFMTTAIDCLKLLTLVLNKNKMSFYYLFIQFNWLQYFWGIGRIVSDDKLLGNIFVIISKIWTHKAKKEKFVGSVIKQVLLAHSWNVILA